MLSSPHSPPLESFGHQPHCPLCLDTQGKVHSYPHQPFPTHTFFFSKDPMLYSLATQQCEPSPTGLNCSHHHCSISDSAPAHFGLFGIWYRSPKFLSNRSPLRTQIVYYHHGKKKILWSDKTQLPNTHQLYDLENIT